MLFRAQQPLRQVAAAATYARSMAAGRHFHINNNNNTINNNNLCRTFATTTPTSFPKKGAEDRNSIDTGSTEHSKTGGDDVVAQNEDAAFNPDKTSPEEAEATAGKGNETNPLGGSGANQDVSKPQGSTKGGVDQ